VIGSQVLQTSQRRTARRAALAALAGAAILAQGCATSGNPKDPIEGFNRAMFALNEGIDKVVARPLARGYETVVPLPGRTVVGNVFSNLSDPWIGVNNLLQGKFREGASDFGRFLLNSTAGILGAMDVASEIGLDKHEEDFGQTLGRWGVPDGPFLVVPLFGPKTLRDGIGTIADGYADPVYYLVDDVPLRNSLYGLRFVNNRALLLPADRVLEEAGLDKYSFVRDSYLQRRRNLIFDGMPPRSGDAFNDEPAATPGSAPVPPAPAGGESTSAPTAR
jgi:phospholipid-binding lipoprotein MlaA